MEKKLQVKNLADWALVAQEALALALPSSLATVITLRGDLGAGKTTLVQNIAKELGVKEVVTSPTFAIMKVYKLDEALGYKYLVHMDAYRIEALSELLPLRFLELLNSPETLLCIEWAEKIVEKLPKNVLGISIVHTKADVRDVVFHW